MPELQAPTLFGVLRSKMPMTREEIEKRMDELARQYAEAHDPKDKEELEELSLAYPMT